MPEEKSHHELVEHEEQKIDLSQLLPLGEQLIENSNRQAQAHNELEREKLEFNRERLKVHKSAFSHKFWLLTGITASILCIAAGLIFYKNNINAGLLMLSHIGAVVVGVIAGSGWERIKGA